MKLSITFLRSSRFLIIIEMFILITVLVCYRLNLLSKVILLSIISVVLFTVFLLCKWINERVYFHGVKNSMSFCTIQDETTCSLLMLMLGVVFCFFFSFNSFAVYLIFEVYLMPKNDISSKGSTLNGKRHVFLQAFPFPLLQYEKKAKISTNRPPKKNHET